MPGENTGDSRCPSWERGSMTRTVALNSQGAVPNSDTEVSYLAECKSVTSCWVWGPSEARRTQSHQPQEARVGMEARGPGGNS